MCAPATRRRRPLTVAFGVAAAGAPHRAAWRLAWRGVQVTVPKLARDRQLFFRFKSDRNMFQITVPPHLAPGGKLLVRLPSHALTTAASHTTPQRAPPQRAWGGQEAAGGGPAQDPYENNPFGTPMGTRPSLKDIATPPWKHTARLSMTESQKLGELVKTFPSLEMDLVGDVLQPVCKL